jgi:hypothetical protein
VSVGLLLIRRRRPIGEPEAREPLATAGVATMDGTAGAGRIVLVLAQAGIPCDSMIQAILPQDLDGPALATLDLGGPYATVVLGSHLVNLPEEPRRSALLALAARHVADDGVVVIEHHPIDWAETAAAVEPTPGSAVGMEDVRRDPPFVSAVSVYDVGGRMFRQPFRARVLSEAELAEAIASAGLRVSRRIGPTWIEARPGA